MAAGLGTAGVRHSPELVEGLLNEAVHHVERLELETEHAMTLDRLGVPLVHLEQLADGVDLGGLYDLASALREQGLV